MKCFRWRPMTAWALAAAALLTGMAANAQALYKSVDANGKVVYSDMPPAAGMTGKALQMESLPVSVVPGTSPSSSAKSVPTGAPSLAPPNGDVVLYMATWCGYCKAAKAYLGAKGIRYREFDIDTPGGKAAFAQIGGKGVPVLMAQGQRVTGFTPRSYDSVFFSRK